jgi:ubiquitin carboxyl-terminal hydrolase 1
MDVDIPTPVTDALLDILQGPPPLPCPRTRADRAELNTPKSRPPPALRPHALLHSLQTLPAFHRLLGTREQQDAHELFVVLAEAVSDEAVKVAAEVAQVKGLGEVLSLQGYTSEKGKGTAYAREESRDQRRKVRGLAQPWEGLMARRRVCRKCSWCEAVRMDTLGGMELPVPLHVSQFSDQR